LKLVLARGDVVIVVGVRQGLGQGTSATCRRWGSNLLRVERLDEQCLSHVNGSIYYPSAGAAVLDDDGFLDLAKLLELGAESLVVGVLGKATLR